MGLPEPARQQRSRGRAVHQAAGVPQGLERHPQTHMTRREFVTHALAASAAMPAIAQASGSAQTKETTNAMPVRVGMTDWNLGQRGDITKIALAREIGLDGIQVSVQYPTDGKTPTLRDTKTQAAFVMSPRWPRFQSVIPTRTG